MDETTKTAQDMTPNEPSSGGELGITSKEPAKTHTESDVEKAVSDALAKAGRTAKELDERKTGLDAEQQQLDDMKADIVKMQEQIDQAELEAAKGDPERLRELQVKKSYKELLAKLETEKKELNKREAELNRSKAEHESEIEAARKTQFEIEIWKIAESESIDPVELKDTMKELNLTTVEQAKAAAKRLNKKPATTLEPDSGVTSGSKGKSDEQKLKDRYPTMK